MRGQPGDVAMLETAHNVLTMLEGRFKHPLWKWFVDIVLIVVVLAILVGAIDIIWNGLIYPLWKDVVLPIYSHFLPSTVPKSAASAKTSTAAPYLMPWWGPAPFLLLGWFMVVSGRWLMSRQWGARTLSPVLDPRALYVPRVDVDLKRLTRDLYIELTFTVFNGTAANLHPLYLAGYVSYEDPLRGLLSSTVELPEPQLIQPAILPPMKLGFITIGQRMPAAAVEWLTSKLAKGAEDEPRFSLRQLDVVVLNRDDNANILVPIWHGFRLYTDTELQAGQIIELGHEEHLGAEDRLR
jgi:hypothetical protein